MSIVIVGGNDRMVRQYVDLCKDYGSSAKVFTQMRDGLKNKIGSPDLMVLFTGTVSHKMVECARREARRQNLPIERSHSSSISALKNILDNHAQKA